MAVARRVVVDAVAVVEVGEERREGLAEERPERGDRGGDDGEVALDGRDGPAEGVVDVLGALALVELVEPVDEEAEADARDDGDATLACQQVCPWVNSGLVSTHIPPSAKTPSRATLSRVRICSCRNAQNGTASTATSVAMTMPLYA